MFFSDSLNTSGTTNQSSIFTKKCFEEISLIQSAPGQEPDSVFWKPGNLFSSPSHFETSQNQNTDFQNLYQENLMLKKKIQDLQSSLNTHSIQKYRSDSFLTDLEKEPWIRSNTQYFCDGNNDSCIKSLNEDFDAALEVGSVKRRRESGGEKGPKKFLKLAMMKSIGTLKF